VIEGSAQKITGAADVEVVKALRKIFIPHKLIESNVIISGEDAASFAFTLGYGTPRVAEPIQAATVLEFLSKTSGVTVKDKAPTYVGGRMGRPEKAKHRDMRPLVHVLFPVGLAGGSHRDLCAAAKKGPVFVEMVKRKCPECKAYTIKLTCDKCGVPTVQEKSCPAADEHLKTTIAEAAKPTPCSTSGNPSTLKR
jgi:DNA polymerase II large subunit